MAKYLQVKLLFFK